MSSAIRFTGLASGLDTQSIVEAMTLSYKNKVDESEQQKLLMEMRRDVYKEVSKSISDFHRKFAGNIRLESAFNKTTNINSNPELITINSGTQSGTHKITDITSLAQTATLQTSSTGATKETSLKDLGVDFDGKDELTLTINDGGEDFEVKIKPDTTLEGLASAIQKGAKNSNIRYDDTAKAFFMSTKGTGSAQKISISVDGGKDVLKSLGLGSGDKVEVTGQDAVLKYNGIEIVSQTNTVSVNGISFTINGKTEGKEITITSQRDPDAIVSTVKEFVDEYNKLLDKLNGLIDAPKNTSYKPLTEEQKKEMSEKDIELWNEKINSSMLSGDKTLKTIVSDMRQIMGSVTESGMLSDIGITTGSWRDKGRLTVDEEKLKKVASENPDKIMDLLAGKNTKDGIADKLYENLDKHFKGVSGVKTSISVFADTKLERDITAEIENKRLLQEKLEKMEDLYYKQFTAMEKMIQQMNTQSAWLNM